MILGKDPTSAPSPSITPAVANAIAALLLDFIRDAQSRIRDGMHSDYLSEVEEAQALLQSFSSALQWPGLALVAARVQTAGLWETSAILVELAVQRLGPGHLQTVDPMEALAGLVVWQCQESLALVNADRWVGTRHIHALAVAQIVERLGGGSQALLDAERALQRVFHKPQPTLTMGVWAPRW